MFLFIIIIVFIIRIYNILIIMDSSGDKLNDLLKAFDKYEESKRSSEDNQESVLTAKQALLDAYRSHSSSVVRFSTLLHV